MHLTSALVAATLAGLAVAKLVSVDVSNDKGALLFDPNDIVASVGDVVQFTFYPMNHSVVQSDFATPCVPSNGGFFSGFHAVAAGTSDDDAPKFFIEVVDTKPIWFYCAQAGHCKAGMVGVINKPSDPTKDLDAFKKLAANVTLGAAAPTVVGAGSLSVTGSATSLTASGAATANATSSAGASSTTSAGSRTASSSSSSSTGAAQTHSPKAQIVMGAGALALAILA